MEDTDFDRALVAAAFELIAERGWRRVTVVDAARRAALPLDRARARFPGRVAILLKFGRLADMAALGEAPADAASLAEAENARDTLFGMIMRRIDILQAHRDGVLALLRELPGDPATALMLTTATQRSMAWLLDAAGLGSIGFLGALRVRGLLGVWLWTVRAWQRDEGTDLSATMAALDTALRRAEQAESMLPCAKKRRVRDESAMPAPLEPTTATDPMPPERPTEIPPTTPPPPPEPPASPPV
jgi:hypothetical protein